MGGAVSSGRDNNELIDNLMGGHYIRTRIVEQVFRALDRADYMTVNSRDQAYKDLAWRHGALHLSAPCIYSEVMEGLDLKPGLSFLNIGSGTGYLSTLVGLVIGSGGINHGIEAHPTAMEYSCMKLAEFIENNPALDEFDFCEPTFYLGNGLCMSLQAPYDRVYCGAGCPEEYEDYFKHLIKVGGVMVLPLNDNLIQIKRTSETKWVTRSLLNVSFATLRVPTTEEATQRVKLDDCSPPRLQVLCRGAVRECVSRGLVHTRPELKAVRVRPPRPPPACPRRICIPLDDDSDVEELNALHDLDRTNGGNEMNALLSLVLSMGQNRMAGALRFDRLDSPSNSFSEEEGSADDAQDRDVPAEDAPENDAPRNEDDNPPAPNNQHPTRRGLLTFQFHRDADESSNDSDADNTPQQSQTKMPENTDNTTKDDTPQSSTAEKDGDSKEKKSESTKKIDSDQEAEENNKDLIQDKDVEMTWEEVNSRRHSTDDDTANTRKDLKRQKLDSGIGEGNSPSTISSPDKSEVKTDESDADVPSDSLTDEKESTGGRRRVQKRGRCMLTRSTSSERSESEDEKRAPRRRLKRRATSEDTLRRVQLSLLVKEAVASLPLPQPLRSFLNYGRCF